MSTKIATERNAGGGRPKTGQKAQNVVGNEADQVRKYAKANGLVCYRLDVDYKEQLDTVREFLNVGVEGFVEGLQLDEHDELGDVTTIEYVRNGARGSKTGAGARVFFPATNLPRLKSMWEWLKAQEHGDEEVTETYESDTICAYVPIKDGPQVKMLFFKDQMMGTTGKPIDAIWGLEKYFSKAHFIGRAAVATAALVKEMQQQLQVDEAVNVAIERRPVRSSAVWEETVYGFVIVASDDEESNGVRRAFEAGKFSFAEWAGRMEGFEGVPELVKFEEYAGRVDAEVAEGGGKLTESEEQEVADRTCMFFRLSKPPNEKKFRKLLKEIMVADGIKNPEGAVESVMCFKANNYPHEDCIRVELRDAAAFDAVHWNRPAFHGMLGSSVRLVRGSTRKQRMARRDIVLPQPRERQVAQMQGAGAEVSEVLLTQLKAAVHQKEQKMINMARVKMESLFEEMRMKIVSEVGDRVELKVRAAMQVIRADMAELAEEVREMMGKATIKSVQQRRMGKAGAEQQTPVQQMEEEEERWFDEYDVVESEQGDQEMAPPMVAGKRVRSMVDTGRNMMGDNELLTRFKKSMGEKWTGELMNTLMMSEMHAAAGIDGRIDMTNQQ